MNTEEFQTHILPLKNKLFRFASVYLAREADAKDVVQDVMLSAWEKLKSPKAVNNLEAWCMTLTRNKALNMLKRKGRGYLQITEQFDLSSQAASPLKQTEENEMIARIRGIIKRLPEKQRAVITLRDIEGYSYKEMVEILKLEMNYIKVLLFRARKQVKKELNRIHDYGISETQ